MKSASMPHVSGKIAAVALICLLTAGLIQAASLYGCQPDSAVVSSKSKAATHHEIFMLLIKQKEYEKAAREANKIFEMKWPDDQEPLLLQELLLVSGQFRMQGQAPLGLEFIEKNSKHFKKVPSRIAVLKEMGYLYKTMKQDDKAYDCFRKAQELENQK